MNILIAIDGSADSEGLLKIGATLPVKDPKVTVCTAINQLDPNQDETGEVLHRSIAHYNQVVREEGQQRLVNAMSYLQNEWGISSGTELVEGDPRFSLVELAEEKLIDLIVIGNASHSNIINLLLGSVSRSVLEHAPCSVLMIPADGLGISDHLQVALGFDNSPSSHRACQFLQYFRKEAIQSVDLYHYCQIASHGHYVPEPPQPGLYPEYDTSIDTILCEGETLVRGLINLAEVGKHAFYGISDIGKDLVEQAEKTGRNLLIIGNRGKSGFNRMLLGSVSLKVAEVTKVPCLVVKERPV